MTLETMTNAQIVKAYERNGKRQTDLNDQFIKDGLGRMRLSEMRARPEMHRDIPEFLGLMDEAWALGIEAELRYGPGLIDVPQLVVAQGMRYRRKKET